MILIKKGNIHVNKNTKDKRISLRLTASEYKQIRRKAEKSNTTISEYILENLDTGASRKRRSSKKERVLLKELVDLQQIINDMHPESPYKERPNSYEILERLGEVNKKLWDYL